MNSPYLEKDIIVETNPDSGTFDYDKKKEGMEDSIKWIQYIAQFHPASYILGWHSQSLFHSEQLHSPEIGDKMLSRGMQLEGDTYVNDTLNFGFFTHNCASEEDSAGRNGSLNRIHIDALVEQFSGNDPKTWPNLLLGCNHARVASHLSVSRMMEGFHTLASDCFRNGHTRELNLVMREDYRPADDTRTSGNGHSKNTIMLSAVFNDWNAWVNGGRLIHRLNHLDELYRQEAEHKNNGTSFTREQREQAYIGSKAEAMSPASVMLAKLMLKLIVENPEDVSIPTGEDFESYGGYMTIDEPDYIGRAYNGDLTQALMQPEGKPIRIRKDAAKVLQHILPEGYSKGGNIITDAVRFLLLDLQRPRSLDKDAPRLFEMDGHPITDSDIRSLVFNLGILAINPGIAPLNAYERDMGMRQLAIASSTDLVIGHLINRPLMKPLFDPNRPRDGRQDCYAITPIKGLKSLGHWFLDALGRSDRNGNRTDTGYVVNPDKLQQRDPIERRIVHEVRSRLRVIHAACFNAVGVSNIIYDPDTDPNHVTLEFSRGASAEDIRAVEKRLKELVDAKDHGETNCDPQTGICQIDMREDDSAKKHIRGHSMPERLGVALKQLADPNREEDGTPELFVSDHIYRKLGVKAPYEALSRVA